MLLVNVINLLWTKDIPNNVIAAINKITVYYKF